MNKKRLAIMLGSIILMIFMLVWVMGRFSVTGGVIMTGDIVASNSPDSCLVSYESDICDIGEPYSNQDCKRGCDISGN